MKNFLILCLMMLLVSCGTTLRNDVSKWDDASAKYESVFTKVGDAGNFGSAVYQISTGHEMLQVHTVLSGTYEIRSDSCAFLETGRYSGNEILEFPVSRFFTTNEEKLCMTTIQINPEFESTVAIFPRYSIVYLQFTSRELTGENSFQFPSGFMAGELINLGNTERYRLIQNCVYSEPRIIKESLVESNTSVFFSELEQKDLGSCYYSLVYTKDGVQGRHGFSVNIYNNEHSPLEAKVSIHNNKVSVASDVATSLCAIGTKWKNRNYCSQKLNSLTDSYIIQVHTNKRSYYEMRTK